MNIVSDRLKQAMSLRNLKQVDLVQRTGIGKSSISTYLSGDYIPKQTNLYKLAKVLSVDPAWLMGEDVPMDTVPHPDVLPITRRKVPLLGDIAAGQPITADQQYDTYVAAGDDVECDFALKVRGDSMEDLFKDGDTVFFRAQDDVDDGQIAAVIIDGEATLKHVYHMASAIQLVSNNPKYPPMIFNSENSDNIRILGLAVGYYRKLI